MRIIAGSARGRQLATFSGDGIRPTPDRVREALFSILYSRRGSLAGAKVLDLFAGSGALAIEALSRGADSAIFVDSSRQARDTIRDNLQRCSLAAGSEILQQDVWTALPQVALRGPFDLIFADPPYGKGYAPRLLGECSRLELSGSDGILVIETARQDELPERKGRLACFDRRRYGLTMLHFFQADDGPGEESA